MLADAARLYHDVLRRQPDNFTALHQFGMLLHQQGQNAEALALLDRAVLVDPLSADALTNRGIVLMALVRNESAVASFDRAIAVDGHHIEAHFRRSVVLRALGRLDDALASIERTLELAPDNVDALNNRGGVLVARGQSAEGIASYRRVLEMRPDTPEAHFNLGVALQMLGRHDEAIAEYSRAVVLRPDYVGANFNRSQCWLALGDFHRGWPEYESRWQTVSLRPSRQHFAQPLWLGDEDLAGRTILLHAEQGFGDILQFCRYAPLVAARTKVILQVPGELMRLMETLDEGGELVAFGDELPAFDMHCPLLSLPLAFRTTLASIPATIPYLRADADSTFVWRDRLADLPGLKVGLVWAGGVSLSQPDVAALNRRRSMALATMAPLAGVVGCSFVSLQKDEPAGDAARPPRGFVLHDFTAELGDFADTAALIANLDLVISVDTAVAHLAGALGKPVWLLNRFDSCWRWLLERDDSPWYPTLRQFRQPSPGDWASPISRVVAALNALAAVSANKKRAGVTDPSCLNNQTCSGGDGLGGR